MIMPQRGIRSAVATRYSPRTAARTAAAMRLLSGMQDASSTGLKGGE